MLLRLDNVSYIYKVGTPYQVYALQDVSLSIDKGEFVGLIGHTGSGKSTLLQHFNGLLLPHRGKVYVDGVDLTQPRVNLRQVRQKVGLVFQYPEHQLFEETVFNDIAFGPRNLGLDESQVTQRVKEAMDMVGLSFSDMRDRSPFALSGGQMRRVAIAGVLAMKPEMLVLDEPTAGLDPRGRDDILEQIAQLHRETGVTVVLVSHSMEDVARYAQRILVMYQGQVVMEGTARQIFARGNELAQWGLEVPAVCRLMQNLRKRGKKVRHDIITVEEARDEIVAMLRGKSHA